VFRGVGLVPALGDRELDVAGTVALGEDGISGVGDRDTGLEAALRAGEATGEIVETAGGPLDTRCSGCCVAGALGGGADPDDAVAFDRAER